jgi:ferredoxin
VSKLIVIDAGRCDGCGACVEVCPEGAIYLVDGRATVDGTLCHACEACVAACPVDAISYANQTSIAQAVPGQEPVVQPAPEVIQMKTQPQPVPLRAKILPVVGATLAWVGREIVPRLADYALDSLDRRAEERRVVRGARRTPSQDAPACSEGGGGRRRRQRRRGG